MSDQFRAYMPTPHGTLLEQIMDCNMPKTEREHAAAKEIERLRVQGLMWKDERDSYGQQLAECQNGYETLEKEVANLKAIDVHSCHANCTRSGCVNARLREAIKHYEAALKLSWPEGAKGKAWEHWNEARRVLG